MTQNEMIHKYMQEHGSITPREALNYCSSMRLSARIHDLRAMGYRIDMKLIYVKNSRGQKVRVAEYRLADE